jgi:hypothetical protein
MMIASRCVRQRNQQRKLVRTRKAAFREQPLDLRKKREMELGGRWS